MDLVSRPNLSPLAKIVVFQGLRRAGASLDLDPASYRSAWRRAALREAVEVEPIEDDYTPSPRRTFGATRA